MSTQSRQALWAAILMMLGIALLVVNDALSKFLTQSYPVGQVLSIRQALGLLVILPYVHWVSGWSSLQVRDIRGQCTRGALFTVGSTLMVLSLSLLPIATVISINFVSPLAVAALSGPLLGEHVSARRWLVIALGFAGVLLIVRPGGTAFQWALLVPVLVALINSLRDILTRRLARTETTISVVFWSSNIVALSTAFSAFIVDWKPLDAATTGWFVLVGVVNAGSHFFMIEAFRRARAAAVAPLRYTGLVWAALFGYVIWGDVPSPMLLAGAALVIASGLLLIRLEARGA